MYVTTFLESTYNKLINNKTIENKRGEINMAIKTVGVVGAGSMGSGIANVFALNGYNVVLRDIEERFVQGGLIALINS